MMNNIAFKYLQSNLDLCQEVGSIILFHTTMENIREKEPGDLEQVSDKI